MSNYLKRTLAAILSFALVLSIVLVPNTDYANADEDFNLVKFSKKITVYKFDKEYRNYYGIRLGKKGKNAKIVALSSSKKGILITWSDTFKANKVGETVLTIKVKNKSGSVKKYKVSVTVKKFKSPFKSLKIGGRNYTKKLGKKTELNFKVKGKKAKFSAKPLKGWKISKVLYDRIDPNEEYPSNDNSKSYKNNDVIKFKNKKGYSEWLSFTMTEKTSGIKVRYELKLK